MGANSCPLCASKFIGDYSQDFLRHYCECQICGLIFVPRSELISMADEKLRYDDHKNSPDDSDYRSYLEKVFFLIKPHLQASDQGLDFGCGRSNVLQDLGARENILIDSYDLFYHPNEKIWDRKYDFIILSEVIEHLRDPQEELKRLRMILKESGSLFIKTKLSLKTKMEFDNWFYKRDKTHIQFFNPSSFEKLSEMFQFQLPEDLGQDLFLFKAK